MYNNLRLQAKYHEFDELLITKLAVLGNSSIEITEEIGSLVANGVKVTLMILYSSVFILSY